ncbi:MAG: peptidoglycan DD-metalloendopeptidase family protein [Xanthomonadales bacterium]|nr:peptidoglycan DD-metalloendopeptidase family protein [Xanthomonadales bacterium]
MMNSRLILLICSVVLLTTACSNRWAAPVEERSMSKLPAQRSVAKAQPEIYTVKRGDSLYTIGFRYGLDYHSIASWNQLKKPYTIFPGQKLHLQSGKTAFKKSSTVTTQPLKPKSSVSVAAKPVTKSVSQSAPKSAPKSAKVASVSDTKPAAKKSTAKPAPAKPANSSVASGRGKVHWQWPTNGTVIESYLAGDPTRSGLDIAGKEGQAIRAAARGSVVYSGNGLLGYGELIIIKHNDRFLSAYAHNRVRLVAEGESIRAGQKIAEMGRGDNGRIKLHFEIRANGKPVNPRQYLPRR